MALRTKKSIYYHIPKTGGSWVRRAMRHSMKANKNFEYGEAELTTKLSGYESWDKINYLTYFLGLTRSHFTYYELDEKDTKGLFSFTFIRHPITWYRSYWFARRFARYYGSRTFGKNLIDYVLDDNFDVTVYRLARIFPMGFLTTLYKLFVGEDGKMVDFVGKQENLREDLCTALEMAGEKFDKDVIMRMAKENVAIETKLMQDLKISKETESLIRKREKWVLKKFYE